MFNFFRKEKRDLSKVLGLTNTDRMFLEKICKALQSGYPNLIHQLEPGFMITKNPTPAARNGAFTFGMDEDLYKRYGNKDKGYFTIRNIWCRILNSEKKVEVEVRLSEDILIGYYCSIDIEELALESLDVSNLYEKHFVNKELNVIRDNFNKFSGNEIRSLDIENTFRIDLEGGPYYTIKNLEDGNYLAVNEKEEVFGLIHDPFEVEMIYPSLAIFIRELNMGNFSFDAYLARKLS